MLKLIARIGALALALALHAQTGGAGEPDRYFAIEIVDEQTGRGVPMVELQMTSAVRYYTDSNGLVAFYEPGLMNKKVWFAISAHGYEFPADGFGNRGAALEAKPGSSTRLKIKRLNLAERLYRITGQGIYRDTVLLGRTVPIGEPLLNAQVTGQDTVLTANYQGKLYWFYGDTNRLSYALGQFAISGATSDSPTRLDPSKGINLSYFTGKDGFSRPMAPMKGEGVVWLFGLAVVPDPTGKETMLAYFQRRQGLGAVLESGFSAFNNEKQIFEKVKDTAIDVPFFPMGQSFHAKDEHRTDYVYFASPYPALRVKADETSFLDLTRYEAYTCLKPGTRHTAAKTAELDRDTAGRLIWGWKANTPPLTSVEQTELIKAGKLKRAETPFRLQDADSHKLLVLNNGSCHWNKYRKRYVIIASEVFGATMLGETWYAESDQLEGPWTNARKIITHANKKGDAHDFYNPTQHPFFDQDGGRVIYLEGTYVNTFSGNPHPTPYYEYNQIMYRLDLSDARLRMREPAEEERR
jgi:hypothetical protein